MEASINNSSAAIRTTLDNLIPIPVSVKVGIGSFNLLPDTHITTQPESAELTNIGQYLADKLIPATGYKLRVSPGASAAKAGNIALTTIGGDPALGDEGYELTVTTEQVKLTAYKPEGLFRGIQTIRQLLPPSIESSTVQPGPWIMPTCSIKDTPRFSWRGSMLDVARHFFQADEVKHYIDLLAYYKMNRFHMHLSDDQGWRIAISSWPKLATYGGSTATRGAAGGYYTQAEYADIVAYAQSRYITVIPETDMPGHTNAALASYAELNCNEVAPALYTGTEVGFSTLCVEDEKTYTFIDDVVREIMALTPGGYFHIGGDESKSTAPSDYVRFVELVQNIVKDHNTQAIGWEEIAQGKLLPGTIVQQWNLGNELAERAIKQGAKLIMSPASKAYLDMKYTPSTTLGQDWAGLVEVNTGYDWEPTAQVKGITESDILGVEAPLWTENIETLGDIEMMAFPRLQGYAEIGWSPAAGRHWDEYKVRLAAHALRLEAMGVAYYRSPLVPWE